VFFLVVLFADIFRKPPIVFSSYDVVLVRTSHTRQNSSALALTLLAACVSSSGANWVSVSHAAPPVNARYSEKSERAGSMVLIVLPAVRSSTPAIRFPCQAASALRFPRK
jgi:hypothetical protein